MATIKSAVLAADEAEALAYRSLDSSHLNEFYMDESLRVHEQFVRNLANRGVAQVAELVEQQWGTITISEDGSNAKVETTEVWASCDVDIDEETTGAVIRSCVPQTIFLHKVEGVWKVSVIDFHDTKSGEIASQTPVPEVLEDYLTYDRVCELTRDQIQLAINLIYAYHGYQGPRVYEQFSSFDWYHPDPTNPDQDSVRARFSTVQLANCRLLTYRRAELDGVVYDGSDD
ncbi:MAG: YARHG domain-containing protein [Armatimonadetes bacterium]|nr:YARHG domain-containing protein [Armatimonadota bacterium]